MPKILIVDDDPDFLLAVSMVLEAHDFEIETAVTAEEALDKLLTAEPDLVILDVMLPMGYEGFEIARAVREKYKLVDLPILMLTSIHGAKKVPYRFAPDKEYLPVDVFMDKPIDPDQLIETIHEVLGMRRVQPDLPL